MKVHPKPLAVAGALLCAALTGCGDAGEAVEQPAGKTAEPVSVAATLQKGVPTGATPAFRYTVKGGLHPLSGVLDAPNKSITSGIAQKIPDSRITLSINFLIIEDKAWAKIAFDGATARDGLPSLPKKWMTLDLSKMGIDPSEDLSYAGETDPGHVSALLEASAALKETGTGTYTGTTDLSESGEAEIVDEATLKALGEKAKAVPIELTADAEGRITRAVLDIPAAGKAKAATYEVVYDQYGSAVPIKAPTGAVKAPAAVYEMLAG